jgi:thiamine monophosphate synthase
MKLILISHPAPLRDEVILINAILAQGVDYFHLRKPDFSKNEMEKLVQNINPSYRPKMVLHSHYDLCKEYGLKGIHNNINITSRYVNFHNFQYSRSLHSLPELKVANKTDAYVLLSPIFDSISKVGYKSNFEGVALKEALYENRLNAGPKVMALGGIDADKIETAAHIGFDGVAVLGALWKHISGNTSDDEKFILKTMSDLNTACKSFTYVR